jgi:hypothetical protein
MMTLVFKAEEYMLPCLNKTLFGTECMGCGLQRSFWLVINGEFTAALHMYPAIYPLILLFGAVALNIIKPSKLLGKLIVALAISSVLIIITSFIIKHYLN